MRVIGLNKILKWCQISSSGRKYTCCTKEINGELCFFFKKEWHKVADYLSDYTEELIEEGGKIFSRPFSR